MTSVATDADLKARHRAMWASGDYPRMVETFLAPIGARLAEASDRAAGARVLAVAVPGTPRSPPHGEAHG